MTLRTCDSSVRAIAAICGADMPVEDANRMIARWRLDWYLAFLEIDFSRAPSSNESSRTNTSGERIATTMIEMRPSSPRAASFRSNLHGRPTRGSSARVCEAHQLKDRQGHRLGHGLRG